MQFTTVNKIQPAEKTRLWIRKYRFAFCLSILLFAALIVILILDGCHPRKIAQITPQVNVESDFWVRILLLDDVSEIFVKTTADLDIKAGDSLYTASVIKASQHKGQPIRVAVINGMISISGQTYSAKEIVLNPDDPFIINLNGEDFRGKLKIILNSDGNSLDVINHVPMEQYLAGVVGAEMPYYWEFEALKAQAVAARTYCLYIKRRFGVNRNWDVSRTQASQVYKGIQAESSLVWKAVLETSGKVLVGRALPGGTVSNPVGEYNVFPAYYSSTCGGHTEDTKYVFGDSFEPLIGVPCPYCKDVAKLDFFYWPTVQFSKKEVTEKLFENYPVLKELGNIEKIEVVHQSIYEGFARLTNIRVVGSNGKSNTLRAEDFRLTVDPSGMKIKSTCCKIVQWDKDNWGFISGRGWGHGVGMCQCGAEGMARQGFTAAQILRYYYPNSKIETLY